MRYFETIQKSSLGGSPVGNKGCPFEHGEPVYIVSKRELISLLYDLREHLPEGHPRLEDVNELLAKDDFVFREPDLPPEKG